MLNDRELLNLCAVVKTCYEIKGISDFKKFISTDIRQVFPHEFAACGIGETPHPRVLRLVNIDFPSEYLRSVIRPNQIISGPITIWLRQQTPLLVMVDEVNELLDPDWLHLVRKLKFQNIASHGLIDIGGSIFSYFSFARIHPSVILKSKEILNFLVPHLHKALQTQLYPSRLPPSINPICRDSVEPTNYEVKLKKSYGQHSLTQREEQILTWIGVGKTNWEISRIVNISENTVKNHVQNIYKKLGVNNRTQATGRVRPSTAGVN